MKYAKLVVPVLALTMVMSACSQKAEETTTTAAETTTEATTTEDETETEDIEDEEDCEEDWEETIETVIPDQSMPIDENYMKYYDYKAYYSLDFASEEPEAKEEDFTDEILKEDFKKLVADGFTVNSAEADAVFLVGEGFVDDENNPIAYLYRGFSSYKDSDDSYTAVSEYIVSQEIIDQLPYIKGEEKDGIITYTEDEKVQCPRDAAITYDPSTQLLKIEMSYTYDLDAVG